MVEVEVDTGGETIPQLCSALYGIGAQAQVQPTHKEIIQEEQALVNQYIVPMKLPHLEEPVPVVGNVIGLSETPGKVQGPPPMIAEHTAEIMREAGFTEDEVMRVLNHSKSELLKELGGNERVAKRLTGHVKEYWGDEG